MSITRKMSVEDYTLLHDSYTGEGGFSDGSYIVAHVRESDDKYKERKKLSFYLNYIQPVVDSHVNPVFSDEPSREYVDKDGLFEQFIADADSNGNSLNRVMKSYAKPAKLKACVLVVVDNYNSMPTDLKSAKDNRILPYTFKVDPELIIPGECEVDERKKLVKVVYYEDDYITAKGTKLKQKREWTTTYTAQYRQIEESQTEVKYVEVSRSEYDHGVLPCFFFYGENNLDPTIMPSSQFLQPAKVGSAIFNLCSEVREIQRKQTFSILTKPGEAPQEGETVGVSNVMYYAEDATNTPAFIAPPEGPANSLSQNIKDLIAEIYRMSCVSYTQQYASGNQSGESKRWTFHITRQVLEDFAVSCEQCEMKIAKIFGAWINHDLQAKITYSRKYGADDIDADIERTDIVLKMPLTEKTKGEAQKKFIRSYFADQDMELIESLERDVDENIVILMNVPNSIEDDDLNNSTANDGLTDAD